MLRIFIGYDPVEAVSYHTLCHSILSQSSVPVSITPINLYNLGHIHKRARDSKQSNEFSFSRFLVPYLCGYEGPALFMDCDMMLRCDIKELFDLADSRYAVQVVKHEYTPSEKVKYLGAVQYEYPRKNWSSVVLWNCGHPSNRTVRPHWVNTATGLELHRFTWLKDAEIGELDAGWNFLVSEYSLEHFAKDRVKNVHWTNYCPWLRDFEHVDFSDEWFEMKAMMVKAVQNDEVGHHPENSD